MAGWRSLSAGPRLAQNKFVENVTAAGTKILLEPDIVAFSTSQDTKDMATG